MRSRILLILFSLLGTFIFAQEVPVPKLNSRITDLTNTLSESELDSLESRLKKFEDADSSQIVVLMLPSTGDESIEEFSNKVATTWKIGRAEYDDGVVLVIAKNDRKLRIEVGYGAEAVITDFQAKSIIDNFITPKFKNDDYFGGIDAGITQIIKLMKGGKLEINSYHSTYSSTIKKEEEKESGISFTTIIIIVINAFPFSAFVFSFIYKQVSKNEKKAIEAVIKQQLFVSTLTILLVFIFSVVDYVGDGSFWWMYLLMPGTWFAVIAFFAIIIADKGGNFSMSSGSSSYNTSNYNSNTNTTIFGGDSTSSYSGSSNNNSFGGGGGGDFGGGGASGSW